MYRNQQNLYPRVSTTVVKLLQYSSSRVELRDGFSSHKLFTVKAKMVNLVWIFRVGKNSENWWFAG